MRKLSFVPVLILSCTWIAAAQGPDIGANVRSQVSFGSPVTLETAPDYNGFLKCAHAVLHPDFEHQDNKGALSNPLKKPALANTAVIVGHGHPGMVCTSNGDDCYLPDQSINIGNYLDWAAWARAWPNKFHSLTILACFTGSGRDGAQFLQKMADAVKMPVRGATDFIWCKYPDGIVLDSDAQWQEATPDAPAPQPISPKARPYAAMTPETTVTLSTAQGMRQVPFASVQVGYFSARAAAGPTFRVLNPSAVRSLIAQINFREPLITSYVPDATVTAQFKLEIKLENGPLTKEFVVLNDRLINDVADKTIYYRTSSSFTEGLEGLRR